MSKPNDIPTEVWDRAVEKAGPWFSQLSSDASRRLLVGDFSRAIMSAEKRGEEREREASLSDLQAVIDDLPSHDPGVCVDMAIRAIRKRGEG